MKVFLFLLGVCIFLVTESLCNPARSIGGKRVVCYFGSWATYRYGLAAITTDDIDPSLCTHFIYTFIGVDEATGSVKMLDDWNDLGKGTMTKLTAKSHAVGTKIMVAVGGWNEGSAKYSSVICNANTRKTFINSVVDFLKKYDFDGFDLDWEYPGQRDGRPGDRECFSALLSELRPIFDQNDWELSAAVSANIQQIQVSYDIPKLSQYLDFINVMTYDLHGSWDPVTGHNAPLYGRPEEGPESAHLNVAAAIKGWMDLGASSSKINLGLGVYGRSFTLASAVNNGIGAPTAPWAVAPSGWISEPGFFGYNDICYNNGTFWRTQWDNVQKVPYAYSGVNWVGYDDRLSIKEKVCWAKANNLGGIMFWSIDTDDFKGLCKQGKFPLVNAGIETLSSDTCDSSTSQPVVPEDRPAEPASSSERPEETTVIETEQPSVSAVEPEDPEEESLNPQDPEEISDAGLPDTSVTVECGPNRLIRDPNTCSSFIMCVDDGRGGLMKIPFTCPGNLVFDPVTAICNYRTLVTGC